MLVIALVDGQLIKGQGGQSGNIVYQQWTADYAFVMDQLLFQYTPNADVPQTLANYLDGNLDYVLQDTALPAELNPLRGEKLLEMPLLGASLTFLHNIALPSNNTIPLQLSRTTLASIYSGQVYAWDDVAIKTENPRLAALLPSANITLACLSGQPRLNDLLARGLSSFSPSFASRYNASGFSFDALPPARDGRAHGFASAQDQFIYFMSVSNALVYTVNDGAVLATTYLGVKPSSIVRLINSAGYPIAPSIDSIQNAMRDFQPVGRTATLPLYLIDGKGALSYPLCFFMTLVMRQNLDGVRDCLGTSAFLSFSAWAISNSRAQQTVRNWGLAPLTAAYQSRVLNMQSTIVCNGETALEYSSLLGIGVEAPFMSSWSAFYDDASTDTQIQYFPASSLFEGALQMGSGDIDFGTNLMGSNFIKRLTGSQASDVQYLPMAGYALSLTYNIPELVGKPPLVLDLYTISLAFAGNISKWNDPPIQALNPGVVLPDATILLPLDPYDENMIILAIAMSIVNEQLDKLLGGFSNTTLAALAVGGGTRIVDSVAAYVNTTAYSIGAVPTFTLSSYQSTYTNLTQATLLDAKGKATSPDTTTVALAMAEFESSFDANFNVFMMPTKTNGSYPLSAYVYATISMTEMTDCIRAKELVQWLWWSISSSRGRHLAELNSIVVPLENTQRQILSKLVDVKCQGNYINPLRPCVQNGLICSNEGQCVDSKCVCNAMRTGTYCESIQSSSGLSVGEIVGIALGVGIPLAVLLVLAVIAALIFVLCLKNRRRENEEWVIDASEIEFSELIGSGGFGEVRKALWRGTDVAVKTVASGNVTNDMRNAFIDEVRVMTALRHPNVVLFMGAATRPPNMCIVMEFMALGSLWDVLHNELLPDIPYQLRIKMMRQAAKGMYFLHSSGIVHRDLKSLNLLLDAKWNVKVSDFGLTKFQDQMRKEGQNQQLEVGSIHWTAPEVLTEIKDLDLNAADVFSFGIVLWEVITRQDVHAGMSPAAVAVAVLRDDMRPPVPSSAPENYASLMTNCWDVDPTVRPTFLEIMTRLESLEEKSTGWGTSSSSGTPGSHRSSDDGLGSQTSSESHGDKKGAVGGVKPPIGEMAIVFTDVVKAGALWNFNAEAMKDATLLHNDTVRSLLGNYGGYEVVSMSSGQRKGQGGNAGGGEGSFCVAFQDTGKALEWCMAVQEHLMQVDWPKGLLQHPAAAEEWGDTDDRLIFRGLRVRMGVHVGEPRRLFNAMSRRAEYVGPTVNTAARITTMAHGGQILVSETAYAKIKGTPFAKEKKRLTPLGKFEMPDSVEGAKLYELRARLLEARFFGGTTALAGDSSSPDDDDSSSDRVRRNTELDEQETRSSSSGGTFETAAMGDVDNAFLSSANLCRWVIDYDDIQLGRQVGMGSYGLVFHGRWKGIEVAVKRFIKQKLTERRLLEFRAEMAFLSELHHPNVVVFIGACVKTPNLCIVTEFVKQGALRDILYHGASSSPQGSVMSPRSPLVRIEWRQRLQMLRSAAVGINFLHTLEPAAIIHRDLKSSNLLVDENWNVKVADFGFARLKEENVTMTRCGTPCWTAPEVIRGERYSEKADVFSFGVIMWEVLARKQPFAGRNFMGVSLDVLEGKRPQVPPDCPDEFKKLMTRCWHAKADKRPAMEDVIASLDKLLGDGGDVV